MPDLIGTTFLLSLKSKFLFFLIRYFYNNYIRSLKKVSYENRHCRRR